MDIKGLYRIVSQDKEGDFHLFRVELDASHPVFGGHFPGNPVLPGICTLIIVRDCAGRVLGKPVVYATIRESKFTRAVIPGSETVLTVKMRLGEPMDGIYPLDGTVSEGGENKLKLKAGVSADE